MGQLTVTGGSAVLAPPDGDPFGKDVLRQTDRVDARLELPLERHFEGLRPAGGGTARSKGLFLPRPRGEEPDRAGVDARKGAHLISAAVERGDGLTDLFGAAERHGVSGTFSRSDIDPGEPVFEGVYGLGRGKPAVEGRQPVFGNEEDPAAVILLARKGAPGVFRFEAPLLPPGVAGCGKELHRLLPGLVEQIDLARCAFPAQEGPGVHRRAQGRFSAVDEAVTDLDLVPRGGKNKTLVKPQVAEGADAPCGKGDGDAGFVPFPRNEFETQVAEGLHGSLAAPFGSDAEPVVKGALAGDGHGLSFPAKRPERGPVGGKFRLESAGLDREQGHFRNDGTQSETAQHEQKLFHIASLH